MRREMPCAKANALAVPSPIDPGKIERPDDGPDAIVRRAGMIEDVDQPVVVAAAYGDDVVQVVEGEARASHQSDVERVRVQIVVAAGSAWLCDNRVDITVASHVERRRRTE